MVPAGKENAGAGNPPSQVQSRGQKGGGLVKLVIEVSVDSAAFQGDAISEMQRILTGLTADVGAVMENPPYRRTLLDVNGNGVGTARMET